MAHLSAGIYKLKASYMCHKTNNNIFIIHARAGRIKKYGVFSGTMAQNACKWTIDAGLRGFQLSGTDPVQWHKIEPYQKTDNT